MKGGPITLAYTPSSMDPGYLKRIFVQREKLLERIVERLSRSMKTGDKHHVLLVGPRGSGKTHLVTLAVWHLRCKPELSEAMRIAWLGEDDAFTGLIHLAFGIASQLAKEYPTEFPADFKTAVRGLAADDAALAVLRAIVKQLGSHKLLLVTENMDQTFHSLGDSGQKKWRAFLQETRKIATLATAQQLFASVSDRNQAFFGFFDIQHLEPLSVENAADLITRISSEKSQPELTRYLKSAEGRFRIRAMHYLAGGNHRMYVLLAEFLTKDTLEDLVVAFENLAHSMTPYFQERLRSLPDQQRQLVQCLCNADGALSVKEVSSETFIDERICSKQLGNLKARGFVRTERRGKESYYELAEPLMRLCLEVKNQRGRPLRLIARFLRAWFPADVLKSKSALGRVGEYCAAALEASTAFEMALAGQLVAQIDGNMRIGEFGTAKNLIEELHFANKPLARKFTLMVAELQDSKSDSICDILGLTDSIRSARTDLEAGYARLLRGEMFRQLGNLIQALADYTAFIDMPTAPADHKAMALFARGSTYEQQSNLQLALADYTAVIDMPTAPVNYKAMAFINRGYIFGRQGNSEQALADYGEAIALNDVPLNITAMALVNRGITYAERGDAEQALADYTTVIATPNAPAEQLAKALINRGNTCIQLDNLERALADYTAVIEMPKARADQKGKALFNRGLAYGQLGDAKLALADYTAFITMPDVPVDQKAKALFMRGIWYWRDRQFQASAADFNAILALEPISSMQRTAALFAVVEPMIDFCPFDQIIQALTHAFKEGDRQVSAYGGTPQDLLWMVMQRRPSEWASYIALFVSLYSQYRVAEKLGQGVTRSIQHLDEGGFSESLIDAWNSTWQQAGADCDDLYFPLRCLAAAVEVMKSAPPTDRPLFQLPLEIRGLVRPLLTRSLRQT